MARWLLLGVPVVYFACASSESTTYFYGDGSQDAVPARDGAAAGRAGADGSVGTGGSGGGSATGGSGGVPPECTSVVDCYHLTFGCNKGVCNSALKCEQQRLADGDVCDDASACTKGETCTAGVCGGGTPVDCTALDSVCGTGACNPSSGACITQPKNNGMACDDADPCTSTDICDAGTCKGTMKDCTTLDQLPCIKGACNKTTVACEAAPQTGVACEDGNPCTLSDTCQTGVCTAGMPKDCSMLTTVCADGTCDTTNGNCKPTPKNQGGVCNDQNECTINDKCAAGVCVGPAGNEGQTCDDQVSCTTGEVCTTGKCKATSPTLYFVEPFASNAAGWTLGTEWEIGPAKASTGGSGDPANDHTPSSDNGVAGVVIGGNTNPMVHGLYYLESPAFNTSGTAPVHLSFYRWLNCLWDAFMHHTVEVWDGSNWRSVYSAGFPGVNDSSWTHQTFDVTQYRNAGMRVRFGFDLTNATAVSSWNIDDVVVASAACP